ncbi:uncharacterized protein LOC100890580 [Strongylocentrotus purpuratus]|uniref:NmrA-like family domain-containing protein 1 n=1 Tax=Strongylocentrotus purpuratus TaxID=7668 RepID=A0A7M7NV13_STRPU|nr:uncharacterized protein LOC100890580 [Strongylocentrotus purpuratus]
MGNCATSETAGSEPAQPREETSNDVAGEKSSEPTKPVVFVFGCTGNVGGATIRALSAQFGDTLDIRAGVRESSMEKASSLRELKGVTVVSAQMGDKDSLTSTLKGVDVIFVTVPPTEDRADLSVRSMEAGKEAGVKHVVVISLPPVDLDILFGRQCKAIEIGTKSLGIPYTILRLPMFVDNLFMARDGIVGQSKIYAAIESDKPYCPVLVSDIGDAAATIMATYEKHANMTYTITSTRFTFRELAKLFSEALGREIVHEHVPYEAGKQAFMGVGMAEWQADGAMELYRLVNEGSPLADIADMGDFKMITGKEPTDIKTWVDNVKDAFK